MKKRTEQREEKEPEEDKTGDSDIEGMINRREYGKD